MSNTAIFSDERYLTKGQLKELLPVVDMTLWRWVRAKKFPAPVQIGGSNFWKWSEVKPFLESRPRGWLENSRPAHGAVANLKARKAAAEVQTK